MSGLIVTPDGTAMDDNPNTNSTPPDPLGPETRPPQTGFDAMPRGSRRHSQHADHSSRRRRSQRLMLAMALSVTLLLLIVVSIFSVIRIGTLADANDAMNAELFQAKQELAKVAPELQQARKELANATQGRLPHLRELTPDKVINVDNGYVKNIVFTLLRSTNGTRYEYRVVMENKSDSMVRPEVRVFVFDHRGIQVGMGEVADRTDMIPGESRSYSSAIERFMDEEPRYFYVWARTKKKTDTAVN
jgi:cell division protein FtsB